MSDRRQDFELLQRFTRDGDQSAFADLVRRHLNLVFATALRKVEDAGGAQEIAQNVFAALARKAWQFAPDDSLPAWLHKAALLESKTWLRRELSRRRRELAAAELGATMHTPEDQPSFQALLPLLDEALLSLREKDRTALLLRFCENQSLRQVGAGLGVSEDTAQKRVQSALEKISDFFKRRGFKTASVAAAAAALQYSATPTASAGMVSAVVSAALHAAPSALLGLSALLARWASLTRVQTGALCVALVAAPMGWQLKEQRNAADGARRIQAQLLIAQREYAALLADAEQLRATASALEQSVATAKEAAARAAASLQAFEDWKNKVRRQLVAADYRWAEDSPFVRIPKSALPDLARLSDANPFSPQGAVLPYARELMGLTPSERQSVESALGRHIADVFRKREAALYETNRNNAGQLFAPDRPAKVFVLPPLPTDEVKQHMNQLLAELRAIVGEERWPLIQARLEPRNEFPTLGTESTLSHWKEELAISVGTDAKGTPTWVCGLSFGGLVGSANGALSMFLPEGDPNRTESSEKFAAGCSAPLRQRAMAWLQEQAIAQLGTGTRP